MPSRIGVAFSGDGLYFANTRSSILRNQAQFNLFHVATPAVAKIDSLYIMVFSGRVGKFDPLSLYLAVSRQPEGPFKIISRILKPNIVKESFWIDNGPGVAPLDKNRFIIYYSNTQKTPTDFIRGYAKRIIRALEITIDADQARLLKVQRLDSLSNLNGDKGAWNESLFCPGYLKMGEKHFLFPATGIYSVKPIPSQSIGLYESSSPLFMNYIFKMQLIDGLFERKKIYPNCKGEIGLDTPSPILMGYDLYLYFSICDRSEGKWLTTLVIFKHVRKQ